MSRGTFAAIVFVVLVVFGAALLARAVGYQ